MSTIINYILFDDNSWDNLLPLTFTRPVAELRVGILTLREKWERYTGKSVSYLTRDYLSEKFPLIAGDDNVLINSSVLPCKELMDAINQLKQGDGLLQNDILLALRINGTQIKSFVPGPYGHYKNIDYLHPLTYIRYPWDIFRNNDIAIRHDFSLLTANRKSQKLSNSNKLLGEENIFAEEGVKAECVIINGTTGPVYLGKQSEIMEGSVVRGPFSLCDHAAVKMASKIYGPTTIGPHSKIGGEINNSVILGYSNKAHDGFLGNSVIGEWCNLGADTNNSNLKNNYAEVKMWNYPQQRFINTGLQFCGLIMGDHTKCGINTMFNTGTVVGVNANIFGTGFPRTFIPSFSWGGAQGFILFELKKAFEIAEKVMARRNVPFNDIEKNILTKVFEITAIYRKAITG